MRQVPLTKGYMALVDDEDYEDVMQYYWFADVKPSGRVYARNEILGRLHRYLMQPQPNQEVHHVNNDGLDCRRANMELVTRQEHGRLEPPPHRPVGRSGVRGVTWDGHKGQWKVAQWDGRRMVHRGYADTVEEAARLLQ